MHPMDTMKHGVIWTADNAGKKGRTSSTFLRIDRNLVVRASRFLARSECPVCAPFNLNFVFVKAIRVGKTFSLGPAPDMFAQVPSPVVRERRKARIRGEDSERRDQDDGGAVVFTDNARLGNRFTRLLVHDALKTKVCGSPSKCRNLQYISFHSREMVYRACT